MIVMCTMRVINKRCQVRLREKEWLITRGAQSWTIAVFFGLLLISLWMPVSGQGAEAPGLNTLIEGARREGRLDVTVVTSHQRSDMPREFDRMSLVADAFVALEGV